MIAWNTSTEAAEAANGILLGASLPAVPAMRANTTNADEPPGKPPRDQAPRPKPYRPQTNGKLDLDITDCTRQTRPESLRVDLSLAPPASCRGHQRRRSDARGAGYCVSTTSVPTFSAVTVASPASTTVLELVLLQVISICSFAFVTSTYSFAPASP